MTNIKSVCDSLKSKIQCSYESDTTVSEAERLAAEFLHAQMLLAEALKSVDLDARMKKSGFKAICAAVYMEAATKTDKKPSDTMLENIVQLSELVQSHRDSLDRTEVERDELQNYMSIFKEAHIYYRGIAKGLVG